MDHTFCSVTFVSSGETALVSLRNMMLKDSDLTFNDWVIKVTGVQRPTFSDEVMPFTKDETINIEIAYGDGSKSIIQSSWFTYNKSRIPDTSNKRNCKFLEIIPIWVNKRFQLMLYGDHFSNDVNNFLYRQGLCHAFSQAVHALDPSYVPQLYILQEKGHVHSVLIKDNIIYDINYHLTMPPGWCKTDKQYITQIPHLSTLPYPMCEHVKGMAHRWLEKLIIS